MLGGDPFLPLGINDHGLAVLRDDAAAAFLVGHGVVGRIGMQVALIAPDRPRAVFGEFPAAVLHAGVVALVLDLQVQLEVFHLPPAPDEELVVFHLVRAGGPAGDAAIGNAPKFRIAIPAREIGAIKERAEAIFRTQQGREQADQGEQNTGGVFHG